jgi:hypothetical protein
VKKELEAKGQHKKVGTAAVCVNISSNLTQYEHTHSHSTTHTQTTDIAKLLSLEWRSLDPVEKAIWEHKSRLDKARYDDEKVAFKIANSGKKNKNGTKRILKDADAPKRPMSAYLAYSNSRRADMKRQHPEASNGDLSKLLSQKWKEATPQEKEQYVQQEAELREQYKHDVTAYRKQKSATSKASRRKEQADAVRAIRDSEARMKSYMASVSDSMLMDQGEYPGGDAGGITNNSINNYIAGGGGTNQLHHAWQTAGLYASAAYVTAAASNQHHNSQVGLNGFNMAAMGGGGGGLYPGEQQTSALPAAASLFGGGAGGNSFITQQGHLQQQQLIQQLLGKKVIAVCTLVSVVSIVATMLVLTALILMVTFLACNFPPSQQQTRYGRCKVKIVYYHHPFYKDGLVE